VGVVFYTKLRPLRVAQK